MNEENGFILLGQAEFIEAKRMIEELKNHGVEAKLQTESPQNCGGGCKVVGEIWVNKNNLKELEGFLRKKSMKTFEGLNVNFEAMQSTFDQSASQATCPACATKFPTTKGTCPECGLVFFESEDGEEKKDEEVTEKIETDKKTDGVFSKILKAIFG